MPNPINQESIPRLPERRDNANNFCTYLMLATRNSRPAIEWKNHLHLKRNFELYQQRNQQLSSLCSQPNQIKKLAEFWREIAIDTSRIFQDWEPKNRQILALEHLASYFETECYHAARTVWLQSQDFLWDEYLCCARVFIYTFEHLLRLLQSYNLSHQTSLDTYIQQTLIKVIKSEVSIGKFSPWRLLAKKSDKELQEALQRFGYQEPNISQYMFARKYFKQVYRFNKVNNPATRKTGQKWPEPDIEDFQAAAESYNAEKSLPTAPHEVSAASKISREQLQTWMENCIFVLQNYPKSINPISLDKILEKGELQLENPAGIETEAPAKVARELPKTINSAFRQHLENLKPVQHKILLLYYGAGFNQTDVANQLQVNQSGISRRLDTIKIKLLKTMVEMSQPHSWVVDYVGGWLQKNYRAPLHSDLIQVALVQAIKELESQEQEVLRLRYGDEQLAAEKIAYQLSMDLLEVTAIISQAQQKLQANLIKVLNTWVKEYVENWLIKFYQAQVLAVCGTPNLPVGGEDISQTIDSIVQECQKTLMNCKKGE
ncbi:sigma-70 family RNA polymerase sigma factor [Kamptonema sp. UHCC 0994]|uniref:sigma-70 family RNA polymerase sigma factor n=1 Tax=Kamptonema sp. UHCC 0994 TaxID=3031329 RepID=UPI0023B9CCA5|nr:sigma-70 family RNA polymerase sigma factor [Kamptonema sp. UHCC 0994]MDF0552578.1 sigma-70 family RNA polymerase sigma factor [Kamptonema sp. UHCC 0994]